MNVAVEAKDFLEKLLPFPAEQAKAVLEKLRAKGLYHERSKSIWRWKDMLTPEEEKEKYQAQKSSAGEKRKREEPPYEPFVTILNEIQKAAAVEVCQSEGQPQLHGEWVDIHDKAPKSENPYHQTLLPDISFVCKTKAEEMKKWGPRPDSQEETSTAARSSKKKKKSKTTNKVESCPWLQIYTVVEVKVTNATITLAQLAKYAGQIFMEQLDRYYVLAFILTVDKFSFHLFDRSGVTSSAAIDIHEAPEEFVAAIASWSCLSPVQLGWDPTVHVWDGTQDVPSYEAHMEKFMRGFDVPWVIEAFDDMASEPDRVIGHVPNVPVRVKTRDQLAPNRYEAYCDTSSITGHEIEGGGVQRSDDSSSEDAEDELGKDEVPSSSADEMAYPPSSSVGADGRMSVNYSSADEETDERGATRAKTARYVAVRSLTLQDAKRLWGRGTLVLEVVSLEDWKNRNDQAEIYVMKQSWQRLPGLDGGAIVLLNTSNSLGDDTQPPEEMRTLEQKLKMQPFEAFILSRAGLDSRLKEAGYVNVNGENVDTLRYIRKGIEVIPNSKPLGVAPTQSQPQSRSQTRTSSRAIDEARSQTVSNKLSGPESEVHPTLVNRTLARMILRLPGVTIREFADKIEFLEGFRGAVLEHEQCYKKGIVQQDISMNNIIISNGHGHLIDFDHSKISAQFKTLKRENPKQIRDKSRAPLLDYFEESAIRAAEEIYDLLAEAYLIQVRDKYNPSTTPELLLSLEDLGWPKEPYDIPSFGSRRAGPGYVTMRHL